MALKLHHLAFGGRDVQRLARFYQAVFELEHVQTHMDNEGNIRSIWLKCGDHTLMIEKVLDSKRKKGPEGIVDGPFLLAFEVSAHELPVYEKRLLEYNIHIESRTQFTAYARDPEGNRVALSHYPMPN